MKLATFKGGGAEHRFSVRRCFVSLVLAFVLTVLLIAIFALALCYSPIPEAWVTRIAQVITLVSVALAGSLCAYGAPARGYLTGAVSGLCYMVILYAVGFLIYGRISISVQTVVQLLYGILAGAIGGIIGINLSKS